ncbi:MAG: hypothetical protein QOE35_3566 [Actinomycetota bacterium]|jgi:hypothetical protein
MAEELEIHEADDGLVVYDGARDRVHHLNATAGVILQLCDGSHDVEAIADFVARGFGLDEPPVDETRTTVERFTEEGLVT